MYTILILIILAIYVLGWVAAAHAALTARTSQGAIAWAVSLAFLPFFALIPYALFGRSHFGRYVYAHRTQNRKFREISKQIDLNNDFSIPSGSLAGPDLATIKTLIELTHAPFCNGNSVQLLVDGVETFPAIFAAIATATRYVVVQYYIVADDGLGQKLKECLLSKAKEGIPVYFLVDGYGSHPLPDAYLEELRAAGVSAHRFLRPHHRTNRFQLNFRNHRKIVVVDGEQAFIGGLNVSDQYMGLKPPMSPWRDTHIQIRGPAVASIQLAFIEDWYWATHDIPSLSWKPASSRDNIRCQIIASGPADEYETCVLFFVQAINSAVHRIWIATPFYVPDEAVFVALKLAALRGVDVRLLIPARADYLMHLVTTLYAHDAVRSGIRVYQYQPGFMHQKVVLVDDEIAAVGSANLDNRSLRLNFEIIALIVDRGFAARVAAMLLKDFAHATPIEPADCDHVSLLRRLGMQTSRLFAPIL
ncbi:MAG: cardiolipin synthase [Gammaproteobacteria bacterium]